MSKAKGVLIIIALIFFIWLASNIPSDSYESPDSLGGETESLSSEEGIEVFNDTQQERCHPSYSGCLYPDASDYDCIGGSGNGPYYTGLVQVLGPDVFGLDRDHDGWGCE
jgi:hypothetical protein